MKIWSSNHWSLKELHKLSTKKPTFIQSLIIVDTLGLIVLYWVGDTIGFRYSDVCDFSFRHSDICHFVFR